METIPLVRSAADREAIRQRFLLVDTSNVADVLDTLGLFHQGLSSVLTPYPVDGDNQQVRRSDNHLVR
jgi:4-hydroxy-4-methyl-2-oxoglutarate aldolase